MTAATLLDAQALQNPHSAERGIGRYVNELAQELLRLDLDPPFRLLFNRHLPVPSTLEPLLAQADIVPADAVSPRAGVLHVPSPFEPVPLTQLWPPALRHLRLAVTVHDLIPAVFPMLYLREPQFRQWYKNRLRFVRHADLVLAPSAATARDVQRRLRMPPSQIVVTSEAPPPSFVPTADRVRAFIEARAAVPQLQERFILYIGGMDLRKNIWGLISAYAELPSNLRAQHQLVIVCALGPGQRESVAERLSTTDVDNRVLFTGFVTDADLVRLCQSAHLFVFPSIYEGYGLPVAEAMACGLPVVAAKTSSVAELITDERAVFNPYDRHSITDALERGLTDSELRNHLQTRRLPSNHSWTAVAARTKDAYEALAARRPRDTSAPRRIAFISPLPPLTPGVADYSFRLLAELQRQVDVDVFVDDPDAVVAPDGVTVRKLVAFDAIENLRNGYAEVICCIGNSRDHIGSLALLRRRPAVVLAHDVRLTDLYAAIASERPDLEAEGYYQAFRRMYKGRYPKGIGKTGWISTEVADEYGVLMAHEILARAKKVLVHSQFAARLLQLDARPRDFAKIEVVPFGHPLEGQVRGGEAEPLVATFGLATRLKRIDLLIDAMAEVLERIPEAKLAVVGAVEPDSDEPRYLSQLERLGLADRCTFTGRVDPATYRKFLSRATVAVQLRASTYGETSAAVADCLAAGVPTVVTALGASRELPDGAVVKVDPEETASDLAKMLVSLLQSPERRDALAAEAQNYARAHSFAAAAESICDVLAVGQRAAAEVTGA